MRKILPAFVMLGGLFVSCAHGHHDASTDTSGYDTVHTDSGVTIIKDKNGNVIATTKGSSMNLTHGGGTAPPPNAIAGRDTVTKRPYYIGGTLIHGEGGNITLDMLGIGTDIHPIAVQAANNQGVFGFAGECSSPQLMQLRLPDGNIQFIVRPNDTIDFSIVLQDAKDYKIKGSPESLQLEEVFNILNRANAAKYVIDDRMKAAKNNQKLYGQLLRVMPEQYHAADREKRDNLEKYITKIDTSFAALMAGLYLSPVEDYEFMKKLDKKMAPLYGNSVFYKALHDKVAIYAPVDYGMKAPEIISQTPDGKTIRLSSELGKVVYLEFWASYSPTSRAEHQHLAKLYQKYKNKGFEIVSYTVDKDKKLWQAAIKEDKMNWVNLSDLLGFQSAAPGTYVITNVPYTFLLDKNGVIVGKNLKGKDLDKKLEQLLH